MNLALPSFGCRGYAKWLLSPSVVTPWCEHCGHRRWSQEQGYVLPIWHLFLPCSLWMFSSKVEMIYFGHRMALLRVWEGSKQFRIFPVWWGLVLAFGWDTLTSWPVVSYASRAALIASSFEMGSQWLGAWMGLTSGSRSRSTGGPRKPRPWKSEVQFLEMNSRVQVPSVGQTRIDVSGGDGGGPAADTWWLSGSVVGGWEGLLVEHFLMKSARRVSTSSALLA